MTPWTLAHQTPLSVGIVQRRTLEWVAMPSSRGSSQPGDRSQVFCIADGFFTVWVIFFFLIKIWFIYYVVLVSGVQQSDSAIHKCISIFFQIIFPYSLLQSIEYSFLCQNGRSLLVICFMYCSFYMLLPNSSFILLFSPLAIILLCLWIYFCFINVYLYHILDFT